MIKHFRYIIYLLFIVFAVQCSTEKDKRLNRFYHNTTAYYNGYFNAREIIRVSHKDFVKGVPEDYSELIPVNRYPNEEQSKALFPEMNRSIDKTSTVINKHAMPNEKKGRDAKKEYGKWMDENWLTMGISYFYKREYEEAIEKFKYIIKMYPKDKSKYYAKMWLSRTYIEMGDFPKALSYINEIEVEKEAKELKDAKQEKTKKRRKKYSKKKTKKRKKKSKIKTLKEREEIKEAKSELVAFPKKMKADFMATKADYFLRNLEYKSALEYLDSAIQHEKKKQIRVRYKFIQAQLNQELGNNSKASDLYSYVIKKGSSYQMIFYSRISRALLANSKNRKNLKEELLKLAKDEKYVEFRDQIYYALADLELQEFKKEEGISYLEQSASYPPSNSKQKAKTFLKLADVYFESKEYVPAQKYYDSTLNELERKNPKYDVIKEKNESLTRLVGYINNIELKDSLMTIGKLNPKQRRDRVEEILYAKKIKEIDAQREKEAQNNNTNTTNQNTITAGQKGSFWIYNEKTKASGIKSFQSVWGNVKLEDDWRRSNKNQSADSETVTNPNSPIVSDEEIDEFLSKVPVTKEEMELAELSIINSNYLSGLIYTNILNDNKEAIKSFKDNKKRFHPNSKITPSLYQLYVMYQEMGQTKDILAVKNFILEKYPESEEAKIILDPNYKSKLSEGEDKFEKSYETAYSLIESEQYTKSIAHIDKVLEDKDPNPFECRLMYLKAKAYFGLKKEEELEKTLQNIVDNCPNTEIGDLSQIALGKLRNEIIEREDSKAAVYKKGDNTVHYFAVVVPLSDNANKLKIALSNFNSNSFDSKGLKTTSVGLDKKNQTIIVKQFANKKEANSYRIAYKVNPVMKQFVTKYKYFIIT
ncbi:MAG: tetratricopeptide repeat protein, partial [Flavobacteriales bacterium]